MARRFRNVALPLMAAGITELKEIVSANGTHVLSATDMKRKYGPSIQTKQVHALHRIAYMLHTEEPVIDVKSTDLSISVVEARRVRLIHPVHRHLTGRDTASNVDIPQARKNEHGNLRSDLFLQDEWQPCHPWIDRELQPSHWVVFFAWHKQQ
jgi:hypothetical protein